MSSVVKWAARKRLSGSVTPGKMGGHRPHLIGGEHRLFVLDEVARDPNMTLHRLSAALAERGLSVHPASVGRFLHREGKSFKKNGSARRAVAAEAQAPARTVDPVPDAH